MGMLALLGSLMLAGGCAVRYVDYTALAQAADDGHAADYRIGSPDELELRSATVPELHGQRVTVQPEGTIRVPLLGEIDVAGMTRRELADALTQRVRLFTRDAEVDVRIERHASQSIFVWGHVASPGAQAYDGRNTAIQALAQARPTARANPRNLLVLEPTGHGLYQLRARIDLYALARGDVDAADVRLRPGEIVHVPPHPLTPGIGQHVDAPRVPDASSSRTPDADSDAG